MKMLGLVKMLSRIKKQFHYFSRLMRANRCWSRPRHSDVLIYDACKINVFLPFVQHWNPEILHVRGEQFNMWILAVSFFRRGERFDAYLDCYIECVKPRLIVTFIDNSLSFMKISRRHLNIKTLFIQNGWRGYHADVFERLDQMDSESLSKLFVDHMLTFGMVSGANYSKYIFGSVTPIGSVKNNSLPCKQTTIPGVIAFVSQWHRGDIHIKDNLYNHEKYSGQVDRLIIQCLSSYANKNKKKLMIIPRISELTESRILEKAHFDEMLGYDAQYLEPEGIYSSYQACDIAEVVVGIDTTLGYESIARGNKTAIFSIRGNILGLKGHDYGWPSDFLDEGLYWTNSPNTDSFIRILDYLFKVDYKQWKQDLDTVNFSSLMLHNPHNSILTDTIKNELELSSKPKSSKLSTTENDMGSI